MQRWHAVLQPLQQLRDAAVVRVLVADVRRVHACGAPDVLCTQREVAKHNKRGGGTERTKARGRATVSSTKQQNEISECGNRHAPTSATTPGMNGRAPVACRIFTAVNQMAMMSRSSPSHTFGRASGSTYGSARAERTPHAWSQAHEHSDGYRAVTWRLHSAACLRLRTGQ